MGSYNFKNRVNFSDQIISERDNEGGTFSNNTPQVQNE